MPRKSMPWLKHTVLSYPIKEVQTECRVEICKLWKTMIKSVITWRYVIRWHTSRLNPPPKKLRHTSKANLVSKRTGIKVGNIARVAAEWPQWIQGQCDGHWDVDQTGVLQHGWRLRAGSRLTAGHRALWCNGLIQAVLEGLVFWDAKVKLVESEKEGVPILRRKKKIIQESQKSKFKVDYRQHFLNNIYMQVHTQVLFY